MQSTFGYVPVTVPVGQRTDLHDSCPSSLCNISTSQHPLSRIQTSLQGQRLRCQYPVPIDVDWRIQQAFFSGQSPRVSQHSYKVGEKQRIHFGCLVNLILLCHLMKKTFGAFYFFFALAFLASCAILSALATAAACNLSLRIAASCSTASSSSRRIVSL